MVRPLIKLRGHCVTFISLRYISTKPILDDTTSTLISNEEMKYRHHLGIITPRTPIFPSWIPKEISNILKEKQVVIKNIKESSKQLNDHLHNRRSPLEQAELEKLMLKVEERLNNINPDKKIEVENIDFRKDAKARHILKQHVYNWQPIKFDKLTSLTYLVCRAAQNYAVLYKILNEIKVRDKDFMPSTLFDFGSGIGTVMWVASELWQNTLKEYFCIETSEAMIKLSEELTKAAKPKIKNVYYRQFFPASINPTYDIVVSAYTLFELPSTEMRLETILKLWEKTKHYLIIVEVGTNAGFRIVNEARSFILKYANSRNRRTPQAAHVFSPCPHDLKCLRFATDDTPCNFQVLYHPLKLLGGKEHKTELYSYVVLKKSKRPEDDEEWPRIVRASLNRSKHTICRMCLSNGELREEIFTSYKHGKHMYRCARASEWGDRLPLQYEQQQENLEDDTTNKTTDVE